MNITCLVDNSAQRGSRFWGEHGLSFLIETEAGRVLYDTGQSGTVLLHNLEVLDIDPATIEALAISHAHYDHTGGLTALLKRTRPVLPLYAHPDLFGERFSQRQAPPQSIGLPLARESLQARTSLRLGTEPQEMWPGIWTSGAIAERPEPEGRSAHHLVRAPEAHAPASGAPEAHAPASGAPEGWVPDPYRDDMSLVVESSQGLILLCGCCHAGLLNTISHVERTFGRPIVALAGGMHLLNATAEHLRRVGELLAAQESVQRIYVNHCSGEVGYVSLLLSLGPHTVRPCPAGTELDLEGLL
jgi:7,8-dihydropterin-6-yl-methyl-4-(beta-D-ribofuranosyl)aminobenzene 5'-phosphate synthase